MSENEKEEFVILHRKRLTVLRKDEKGGGRNYYYVANTYVKNGTLLVIETTPNLWSDEKIIFQIPLEDIYETSEVPVEVAYDPDNPSVVHYREVHEQAIEPVYSLLKSNNTDVVEYTETTEKE